MLFSFIINTFACLFNVFALAVNGGSNPTMMVVNGACVLVSGYLALLSLKNA